MKKYIITIFLSTLFLTSCTKTDVQDEGNWPADGVVRIETSISAPVKSTSAYTGEDLGLFLEYASDASYSKTNIEYTNTSGTWASTPSLLWKDKSTTASLYAYAPYNSTVSNYTEVAFTIPADQTGGYDAADLVYDVENIVPSRDLNSNGAVDIDFVHALVKMNVKINFGTSMTNLSVTSVKLLGTTKQIKLNIESQLVTNNGSVEQDITMCPMGTGLYSAIFYPGNGQTQGNHMIEVNITDGNIPSTYYFTTPTDWFFNQNTSYTITLKVGQDKLDFGSITVDSWDTTDADLGGGITEVTGFQMNDAMTKEDFLAKVYESIPTSGANAGKLVLVGSVPAELISWLREYGLEHVNDVHKLVYLDMSSIGRMVTLQDFAFYDNSTGQSVTSLKTVFLPFWTTEIGQYAFYGCSLLQEVNFPYVTTVGQGSLSTNSTVSDVKLPKCTSIGDSFIAGMTITGGLYLTTNKNITLSSASFTDFVESANTTLYLHENKRLGSTGTPSVDADGKTWGGMTWKAIKYVNDNGDVVE